jgi:hypothetical protein
MPALGGDHLLHRRAEVGLGVDEELARGDDLLAAIKAVEHLDEPVRLRSEGHVSQRESALAERHHDHVPLSRTDDSLGRGDHRISSDHRPENRGGVHADPGCVPSLGELLVVLEEGRTDWG